MIFSTRNDLKRLSRAEVIIMDGTFSCAPQTFKQIFTIHGSIGLGENQKFVPLIYILLPSKTEEVYKKAFELLKRAARENGVTLDPTVILTDFESAEINAIRSSFPECTQYGCFFHLAKNFWKRIQKLGLVSEYSKNCRMEMAFRQTEALAFLPPQEVVEGFMAVRASAPKTMGPFFDYVDKIYIRGKLKSSNTGDRWTKPRFPPEFWSTEQNTIKNIPRTTNAIEGWHNKFNSLFRDKNNPKLYEVIKAFQQEQRSTDAEFLRALQGDEVTKRNKKVTERDRKLKKIIADRENDDISLYDHIQAIALILRNK